LNYHRRVYQRQLILATKKREEGEVFDIEEIFRRWWRRTAGLRSYFTALFPILWRAGEEREETDGKEWELVVFYDSSFHFVREIPWNVRMQSHHYVPLSRKRN
jgi:hypothetical protein